VTSAVDHTASEGLGAVSSNPELAAMLLAWFHPEIAAGNCKLESTRKLQLVTVSLSPPGNCSW
jgi:hypothetical protein